MPRRLLYPIKNFGLCHFKIIINSLILKLNPMLKKKGKVEPVVNCNKPPVNPPLEPYMEDLLEELRVIVANPVVEAAYNDAIANVVPYVNELGTSGPNPWVGTTVDYFVKYFEDWFTFLPIPGGGLGKIVPLTFFYLNNQNAYYFLNEFQSKSAGATKYSKEIFNWTKEFVIARGKFMDSPESLKYITCWEDYLRKEGTLKDYKMPKGGYKDFNQFFTRTFKDINKSRPITEPTNDSILTSSADSEINYIQSNLTMTTNLQVKTTQINVLDLLNQSTFAEKFVGGTAVSCVLMPNDYHRYHSPVTGTIVESDIVDGIYNGIKDGEHWFNQGNIGESTTDFSIFEKFHRGYFIIKTKDHGLVAVIPVGLNTISSVIFEDSAFVPPSKPGKKTNPKNWKPVKKGEEIGHFAYGGSLNILLFQPGVFGSVSVLMGQRLGELGKPSN